MTRDDRAIRDALHVLEGAYGVPASVLRRVAAGYRGDSPAVTADELEAGQGVALRLATAGASLQAVVQQRTGFDLAPYARDRITERLSHTLEDVFGPGTWLPCPSGTAASAVALRMLAGHGSAAVFVEDIGHALTLEAGAATAAGGGRVIPIRIGTDPQGKMSPASLERALLMHCPTARETTLGRDHFLDPAAVVLSWPSSFGFEPSPDELRRFREICDRRNMSIVLDLVWGLHKAAEHDEPEQRIRELMSLVDAAVISLPKLDCGPGAFLFVPRADDALHLRLAGQLKPLGGAQLEAWETSARWDAVWSSHRVLLWQTLRSHNQRARRLRSQLEERGLCMWPPSAGNLVFFSVPAALSDTLAERGATRWPLYAQEPGHVVHRIAMASWYRPGWEDTLLEGIGRSR